VTNPPGRDGGSGPDRDGGGSVQADSRSSRGAAADGSVESTRFLPEIGQDLLNIFASGRMLRVHDDELVQRVADSLGIEEGEAQRIVGEVIAYYQEPVESYILRRHATYKRQGLQNAQIFPLLIQELDERLVAPPRLSERQVRRIIYG
jgi:hypothetical protein